ncbi:MAG: hypothetical protein K2P80_00470 [Beijerinckiaceae bacterium]|nr:hypothetical protein [Beijerinckiaceae bacterium]
MPEGGGDDGNGAAAAGGAGTVGTGADAPGGGGSGALSTGAGGATLWARMMPKGVAAAGLAEMPAAISDAPRRAMTSLRQPPAMACRDGLSLRMLCIR